MKAWVTRASVILLGPWALTAGSARSQNGLGLGASTVRTVLESAREHDYGYTCASVCACVHYRCCSGSYCQDVARATTIQ